ncbi:aquaporin family protein [Gemmatimonadales bacterium]|nr:aquaporin family protein [Gemmatimonadales bacterium]
MKKYITELIGTFFLVLTIGMSVTSNDPMGPLAIGFGLAALVYMGGHISGAHYNPAVTVGFLLTGGVPRKDVAPYMTAQVVGALLASKCVYFISAQTFAPIPNPEYKLQHVLLCEFLFTFMLMLVILNVAMSRKTRGNAYYGIAIGLTVTAGAISVGDISGAVFNPAVALGPTIIDVMVASGPVSAIWIYILAPVAGAVAAVPVFQAQEKELSDNSG